jgi:hypothetical protein
MKHRCVITSYRPSKAPDSQHPLLNTNSYTLYHHKATYSGIPPQISKKQSKSTDAPVVTLFSCSTNFHNQELLQASASCLIMRLLRKGFPLVMDSVIPKSLLSRSVNELRNAKEVFRGSGQSSRLRTDSILWVNEESARERGMVMTSEVVTLFKKHITESLTELSRQGDKQAATSILPKNFMISHYDGDKEAFYTAHRDGSEPATASDMLQCMSDVCIDTWKGGISSGLQTLHFSMDRFRSEKNFRNYTAILYLNVSTGVESALHDTPINRSSEAVEGEWALASDGGALRCFVGAGSEDCTGVTATEVVDVAPIGGRVVMFDSRELLHAVLPTKRSRLALSAWIFSDTVLGDDEISAGCVVDS